MNFAIRTEVWYEGANFPESYFLEKYAELPNSPHLLHLC